MELTDIYDKNGIDGKENEEAFNKLPVSLKYFISTTQNQIISRVKNRVKEQYGEIGLQDLVKTSGFRAVSVNNRYNGVVDSLHLFGCAVDFAKKGIFKDKFVKLCCNLQLIDSGKCWHVQLKRGL